VLRESAKVAQNACGLNGSRNAFYLERRCTMLNYLVDVILLTVICSIPYLVTSLRLQSSRSRKDMYDLASAITVAPKDRF